MKKKWFRVVLIFLSAIAVFRLFLFVLPFPELERFVNRDVSTRIFDRNGELLQVLPLEGGLRREFRPLSEIPDNVRAEFIRAEDKRFYFHFGIDFIAVARSFVQNVRGGRRVSGASTMTMQLARMVCPSERRDFRAKIRDSINAIRIEGKFSKKRILELYLNNVPFGKNCEGVVSTARTFFEKNLSELTDEEIKKMASIPRNPNLYNNLEKKFIYPFHFPHYIRYLKASGEFDARKRMNRTTIPEKKLSVDLQLQVFAENQAKSAIERSGNSRISNAAVFVCDAKSGEVLSWVGSEGWDDGSGGQIDGVLNRMQPGSSMKPFLYATALDNGYLPTDILSDIPKEFGERNLYIPQNFNNRFNGPVRFRVALASSLNIPAVSILDDVGVPKYMENLTKLGFDSLVKDGSGFRADLGLSLGAGEVSLRELTEAFRVFVCDGELKTDGEKSVRVFSEDSARIICSILSDKNARAMGFGYFQTFETNYPAIFKTGTANQYQSIVALGSTKNYSVGVWMGNFSGSTVIGKTGSSLPAAVAKSILDLLEKDSDISSLQFDEPENFTKRKICALSGKIPGKFCKSTVIEYVPKENADFEGGKKIGVCTWHTKDGTFLPGEYQRWLSAENFSINYGNENLSIVNPKKGSVFYFDESRNNLRQVVRLEAVGGMGESADVFLDGKKIARLERPFILNFPAEKGEHELSIDCAGESDSVLFVVR